MRGLTASGARLGSHAAARPRRRGARVRQPRSSSPAAATTADASTHRRATSARQAVRQRHRRRRLGPRGHARGRRQAVQPQPLRQLGHLVQGLQRPERQDGLARALDRPQRQRHQPAAGDLDRHRALEGDPHPDNPVCAIPSLPFNGFMYSSGSIGGVNNLNLNTTMRDLSGSDADDENAYLGRSRATYGLAVETWQRLSAITSATRRRPRRRSRRRSSIRAARSARA